MRPASYDAQLRAYAPYIRKLARKIDQANGEDVAQDINMRAVENWHIYDPAYSFGHWVRTLALSVQSERYRASCRLKRKAVLVPIDQVESGEPPCEELRAELSEIVRMLSGRGGEALLRNAMGEDMKDIGLDMGVGRCRVGQLIDRERKRLMAATGYVMGEAA